MENLHPVSARGQFLGHQVCPLLCSRTLTMMRVLNSAPWHALYLPGLPDPLHRKAEPMILDAGPSPTELYHRLSCILSQLHFPAGLRGRCSQPHFTVEIPEAQKAEVTFARLQRKLVAELALKPRHPMSCLRLSLLSLYRLPAACHHRPPPICMLCHRDGREVKPTAFSRKGGTCDYFLATVWRRH